MNVGIRKNNTSGFIGVYIKKNAKKWCATMKIATKPTHLGYYNTKEQAAIAWNEAMRKRTDIREEVKVYNNVI